jgi:hypothetical protein
MKVTPMPINRNWKRFKREFEVFWRHHPKGLVSEASHHTVPAMISALIRRLAFNQKTLA